MTCWDLLPPSDPKELPTFLEAEDHAVFEQFEKDTGDTLLLCCVRDRTTGSWDTVKETYNEMAAERWFNNLEEEG